MVIPLIILIEVVSSSLLIAWFISSLNGSYFWISFCLISVIQIFIIFIITKRGTSKLNKIVKEIYDKTPR